MSLRKQINLAIFIIFLSTFFSIGLGYFLIGGIRDTNHLIRDNKDILHNALQLRQALRSFNRGLSIPPELRTVEILKSIEDDVETIGEHYKLVSEKNAIPPLDPAFLGLKRNLLKLLNAKSVGLSEGPLRKLADRVGQSVDLLVSESMKLLSLEASIDLRNASRANHLLLLNCALSIFLLSAGIFWFRRFVWRRIKHLGDVINQAGMGDLNARCSDNKKDEIGSVGFAINSLIHRLENNQKARLRFIECIGHDLLSPLSTAYMSCQHDNQDRNGNVSRVLRSLDKIKRLSLDLEEVGKEESPLWGINLEMVSLKEIVYMEVEDLRIQYPSREFKIEEFNVPDLVRNDRDRLSQILRNLVSNAVKYSPSNSPIDILIGSSRENEFYLEVRDKGEGIPDAVKGKIFEPHYRLEKHKTNVLGSGLGLSTVLQIVTLLNGRIIVLDRNNGGTIFRVSLPSFAKPVSHPIQSARFGPSTMLH